jgi:hypothetical protein
MASRTVPLMVLQKELHWEPLTDLLMASLSGMSTGLLKGPASES